MPVAATVARLGLSLSSTSTLSLVLVPLGLDLDRRLVVVRVVWEAEMDVSWEDLERVMRTEARAAVVVVVVENCATDSASSEISSSFLFGDGTGPGSTSLAPGLDGDL